MKYKFQTMRKYLSALLANMWSIVQKAVRQSLRKRQVSCFWDILAWPSSLLCAILSAFGSKSWPMEKKRLRSLTWLFFSLPALTWLLSSIMWPGSCQRKWNSQAMHPATWCSDWLGLWLELPLLSTINSQKHRLIRKRNIKAPKRIDR